MARTTDKYYIDFAADQKIYAKPCPHSTDPAHGTDIKTPVEIPRGSGADSQYVFSELGDGPYTLHHQAGEQPANTDKPIGQIGPRIVLSAVTITLDDDDDDPTLSLDDDCLKFRSGDDYQGDRAIRVDLDTAADLTGKYLIVAAKRSSIERFSYRVPIEGSAGDHHAMIDPPSTTTCDWAPDRYAGLIRIEHDTDQEQTIWEGTILVSAFPTPPAAE